MMELIPAATRGFADHGWLKALHSFSFADFHDPRRMGFGPLRVINEDRVAPGTGFGMHGHRDMEIVTYVLAGQLSHRDSMGNGAPGGGESGVIGAGDVQRMSAGRGVMHSEFNHSPDTPVHLLQIWIRPVASALGQPPSYEQRQVDAATKRGRLALIAAPPGTPQALLTIHADARLYAGLFDGAEAATLDLMAGRSAYIHLVRGALSANGQALTAGDALQVHSASRLHFSEGRDAEVLVFDLPA